MSAQPDQDIRAIIYTRVSHDRAGGRSVAEQEAECRQECERRGWRGAEVLTDNDRSATRFATKDRPEYARLRTLLQPGDVLVVWEASRVGRSLDTYVDLRRLCIER
ncbi:MAG TPA: recombinase family protein, partial [Mycobacterium sp.]|nr:recombinase family protein [Mycobacterium sp.]